MYLRADPSTANPPIGTLRKGAKVTLVEVVPKDGFYHVKTTRGKEGWVGTTYLAAGIQEPSAELAAPFSSTTGCDATLWDHVYNPETGVEIVGSYVQDTNHAKWMEIHPVSKICHSPAPRASPACFREVVRIPRRPEHSVERLRS